MISAPEIEILGELNGPERPGPVRRLGDLSPLPGNAPAGRRGTPPPPGSAAGQEGSALVLPFPYAAVIRDHLERERISAARSLLEVALSQEPHEASLLALQRVLAPPRVFRAGRNDVDRSDEYRWLATNGPAFRGYWVAVAGGALLAHARSLQALLETLKARESDRMPLVCRIPDEPEC